MKRIPLTQGQFALVDDADFDWLSQWNWHAIKADNTFYASRKSPRDPITRKQTTIGMHSVLLPGCPRVDHQNRNGLDNQRHNLRPATFSQNNRNRRKRSGCSSQYKGVHSYREQWMARIYADGQRLYLGSFSSEVDAAKAYDAAARKMYREFAVTNF